MRAVRVKRRTVSSGLLNGDGEMGRWERDKGGFGCEGWKLTCEIGGNANFNDSAGAVPIPISSSCWSSAKVSFWL
jgi:hypothetical protein